MFSLIPNSNIFLILTLFEIRDLDKKLFTCQICFDFYQDFRSAHFDNRECVHDRKNLRSFCFICQKRPINTIRSRHHYQSATLSKVVILLLKLSESSTRPASKMRKPHRRMKTIENFPSLVVYYTLKDIEVCRF